MQVSGKGEERERSGVICGAPFLCLPLTAPTGTGSDEFVGWESWKAPGSLPSLNLGMVCSLSPELGGLLEPPQGVCVSRGCFSWEDSHSCCPLPVTCDVQAASGHWCTPGCSFGVCHLVSWLSATRFGGRLEVMLFGYINAKGITACCTCPWEC